MKTPAELRTDITRRLGRTWATDLTGETASWPHPFPLGNPTKTELETGFTGFQQQVREWRDWARTHHVGLTLTTRRVYGTTQDIPTHATITDLAAAARLAGPEWANLLTRATTRLTTLQDPARFPAINTTPDPNGEPASSSPLARLLRATDTYTDTDFALLTTVADWFIRNDATGYTPRQVPIEGIHAKWLNTHQPHLLTLTGRNTLGLLPRHPARIHFTYLDPTHRANGARWHDSATVGDPFTPAYTPTVVLISENKDTAIHFPPTAGGVSVEGAGYGGTTAAAINWLTNTQRLYYWGDIDAHGYEILNGYRQDGLPVVSILMDPDTYDAYARYGTNHDQNNQPLTVRARRSLPRLTEDERVIYERLTDPAFTGYRRIEQERIPLAVAHAALQQVALERAG